MGWILLALGVICIVVCVYNFIGFIFTAKKRGKRFRRVVESAIVVIAVCFYVNSTVTQFEATYPASKTIFSPADTVMVVVPHPDDDLLLAAPVMACAAKDGAQVLLVMATNGDARGLGLVRLQETLKVLAALDIPAENAIFMGYSNGVLTQLYQTETPDEAVTGTARSGQTQTAGLPGHPDYHTARYGAPADFTRDNFSRDLLEIIRSNRPTHLYIIDWDSHAEHLALSLFADEALAAIFKTPGNDYFPRIYKGFAYNTGFKGPRDINKNVTLLPTFPPEPGQLNPLGLELDNPHFMWAERLRMPVPRDMLYPDIVRNRAAQVFRGYMSQKPLDFIPAFINSDKPYWERPAASIAYNAKITASSGNVAVLNDFKLLDGFAPEVSLWTPANGDTARSFTVDLGDVYEIAEVRLYFNPNPGQRITMAHLAFDGDKVLLDSFELGKPVARVDGANRACRQITFQINGGDPGCGVAEIEIFTAKLAAEARFIKIADASPKTSNQMPSNFAYALFVDKSQTPRIPLELYAPHAINHKDVVWQVQPAGKGVSYKDDYLHISDTARGRYTLTASVDGLDDSVGILLVSEHDLSIYHVWRQMLHLTKIYDKLRYVIYRQKVKL